MNDELQRAVFGSRMVLTSPSEIDAGWLTQALRAAGCTGTETVVLAAAVEPVGTGQMADTLRVTPTYDGGSPGPTSLIAKIASSDEQSRSTGKVMRAYEVEVRFYVELATQLRARVPGMYFAAFDPEATTFTLLLEDVVGASQGDQLAGCDADVAEAAIGEMVGLHAPAWESSSLASLPWLNRSSPTSEAFAAAVVTEVFPGFLDRYGDQLAAEHVALLEAFIPRLGAWQASRRTPKTVVHADFRLDNLLLSEEGARPVVVDFQTVTWGAGASDLAYFIGASLTPAVRHEHEAHLVGLYRDQLLAGGVAAYAADELWRDYRRESFVGIVMAIGASMLVKRTERGDAMFLSSASRHAQHAIDLDALSLLEEETR